LRRKIKNKIKYKEIKLVLWLGIVNNLRIVLYATIIP
jgi:hypothetical protein